MNSRPSWDCARLRTARKGKKRTMYFLRRIRGLQKSRVGRGWEDASCTLIPSLGPSRQRRGPKVTSCLRGCGAGRLQRKKKILQVRPLGESHRKWNSETKGDILSIGWSGFFLEILSDAMGGGQESVTGAAFEGDCGGSWGGNNTFLSTLDGLECEEEE